MKIKRTQGNKVVNITVDFEKEEIYGKFKLEDNPPGGKVFTKEQREELTKMFEANNKILIDQMTILVSNTITAALKEERKHTQQMIDESISKSLSTFAKTNNLKFNKTE